MSEIPRNKPLAIEDLTEIALERMQESLAQVADRGRTGERSCKAAADTRAGAVT